MSLKFVGGLYFGQGLYGNGGASVQDLEKDSLVRCRICKNPPNPVAVINPETGLCIFCKYNGCVPYRSISGRKPE